MGAETEDYDPACITCQEHRCYGSHIYTATTPSQVDECTESLTLHPPTPEPTETMSQLAAENEDNDPACIACQEHRCYGSHIYTATTPLQVDEYAEFPFLHPPTFHSPKFHSPAPEPKSTQTISQTTAESEDFDPACIACQEHRCYGPHIYTATTPAQTDECAELSPTALEVETRPAEPPQQPRPPARMQVLLPALIVPFSILGLLIRLGLTWIETFSGQQVFALAWPQFVGCVLMGLFVSTRAWIEQAFMGKGTFQGRWIGTLLYVAVTSGLCGSITTFSSWNLGVFVELINISEVHRNPLQNILSALSELVITLAISITGLQFGTHLAHAIAPLEHAEAPPEMGSEHPSLPHWSAFDSMLLSGCSALWFGMVLAAIFMPEASWSSWRHVVLACCFAPPGAILRWYLSRFNARLRQFPLGTFAVNVGGSLILAVIVCLQHTPGAGGRSKLACQVLSGLQDGFCGCLTTISTFALELRTLPRKASYVYGIAAVIVAQICMLVVLGVFVWTRQGSYSAYQSQQCST